MIWNSRSWRLPWLQGFCCLFVCLEIFGLFCEIRCSKQAFHVQKQSRSRNVNFTWIKIPKWKKKSSGKWIWQELVVTNSVSCLHSDTKAMSTVSKFCCSWNLDYFWKAWISKHLMQFSILEIHLWRHDVAGRHLLVQDLVNLSGEKQLNLLGRKMANSLMIHHCRLISRRNSIQAPWCRGQASLPAFQPSSLPVCVTCWAEVPHKRNFGWLFYRSAQRMLE